ncbi:hypothetical protein [Micromonospora wenchangensis]|uniref:hypothetical protein n=1 Tax=Micromonospora wenchangensis TaxID=1185415 RepID=UPI003D762DEA
MRGRSGWAAVAARTGLARPSTYQYFRSRTDLLDAVIVDLLLRWSTYVTQRMRRASTPGDRVLAYVAVGEARARSLARGLLEPYLRQPTG